MTDLSLAEFLSLSDSDKVPHIGGQGILVAEQFERSDLDALCALADAARALHRHRAGQEQLAELLRFRMALNFFVQPSSRTFMSFNTAQAWLGMNRMSVRDLKISSMSKGESLVDSVRTFISYVDLVVIRHADEHAAAAAMWTSMKAHRRITLADGRQVPIPVINGGSGTKQHPTQALLDIYTLQRHLGALDERRFLFVGDLARGRTVRSLCLMMRNYRDTELLFAAPGAYQMKPDILRFLDEHGIAWRQVGSIDEGLEQPVDAVYMTRIQDEWDDIQSSGHVQASAGFRFTPEHLTKMPEHAALMHPLPKRDEIDPSLDYIDDSRVAYWRQERNGMWMRVAIIAQLFGVADEVHRIRDEVTGTPGT